MRCSPEEGATLDRERSDEIRGHQREVLDPRERRQARESEKHELSLGRRPVDRLDSRRDRREGQRVRDEIGDRERDHHEHRDDERKQAAEVGVAATQLEVTRDHVDRDRCEGCRQCVLGLDEAIGSLGREEAPERSGDQRLEESREVRRLPVDHQAAVCDRSAESRVDVLVREVARGGVPQARSRSARSSMRRSSSRGPRRGERWREPGLRSARAAQRREWPRWS